MAITPGIRVKHYPIKPFTAYQRDLDGRTVILLSAQDFKWCQYMYQFSHELCHVATNYDSPPRPHEFGWLEETICELASWTTLGNLSNYWKVDPPFANWKNYWGAIREYRQESIDSYKKTADPRPLKQWFRSELPSLRTDSLQREKNAKIALAIMPHFYEHASGWKAASQVKFLAGVPWDERRVIFYGLGDSGTGGRNGIASNIGGIDLINADSQFVDSHKCLTTPPMTTIPAATFPDKDPPLSA
jgi:hypothetical protein